jgi:predicted NACHT family NTPase
MASIPLLLTMMALVLYNRGELPRDRPQLYENILDLLLGRWDTVQEKGGQTLAEYVGIPEWDTKRILPLLDRLSYEAHRTASSSDGRGRLDKTTVRTTLIKFLEQAGVSEATAFEKAGRCIDYIQQRSGLLIPDGDESYVFAHLTLQEHCAGRYIVLGSEDPVKLVLEHRADDRWREPIMLGLGLAPPADLDDVFEALWERGEAGDKKSWERWYQDLMLVSEIGADR